MQYLLLAVAFLSSTLTLAAPSGRGFAYSPEVSPGVHPGLEPHCVKMEMDLESCFKEDDLTGDISVDQETIKECVCGNESFSMEVVTSWVLFFLFLSQVLVSRCKC